MAEGRRIAADAVKSGLAVEQLFPHPSGAGTLSSGEAALPRRKAQKSTGNHPELAQKLPIPTRPKGVFCVLPMPTIISRLLQYGVQGIIWCFAPSRPGELGHHYPAAVKPLASTGCFDR